MPGLLVELSDMEATSRKRVLILLVMLIEFFVLGVVGYLAYKAITRARAIERINAASVISEEKITYPESELKYYYTFLPNETISDSPDWLKKEVKYTINADGFNERRNYSTERDKNNVFRIVTLGDSFTFGHFVNTSENWTEVLEDLLNNSPSFCGKNQVEVINLGMPGYDVEYITHRYLDAGHKYDPDLVLWFESNSGFTRVNEINAPIIDGCEKQLNESTTKDDSRKYDFYQCWVKAEENLKQNYTEEWLDGYIAKDFPTLYETLGKTPLILATFDIEDPLRVKKLDRWKIGRDQTVIFTGVPVLKDEEKLSDGHPNAQGHKKIAKNLYEYLQKEGEKFCQN